ncbi:MAG: SDR family NAD(P)-dependent oxidoreductase, partial [Thermoanaerobaculia bacterium]
ANNVGGVFSSRQTTVDGDEKTFQVNHLAGFLLTSLLRERLEKSSATVINTSSGAHHLGRIDLDDLESERSYSGWRAYGSAKLMNILHASELNRRFRGVRGVSFHPGVVATGFAREGSSMTQLLYSRFVSSLFMISSEKGADTLVWLATTNQPPDYYVKRKRASRSSAAKDPELARKLWDASAKLIGA